MNKLKYFFLFFFLFFFSKAYALENDLCRVSIEINGAGKVINNLDKNEYDKDTILEVACNSSLDLSLLPDKDYEIGYLKYNDLNLNSSNNGNYVIKNLKEESKVLVLFSYIESKQIINDETSEIGYYAKNNKIVFNTTNDYAEINLKNINNHINESTTLDLTINDISLFLGEGFLNTYKDNKIKFAITKKDKNDISGLSLILSSKAFLNEIKFYVDDEVISEIDYPVHITVKSNYFNSSSTYVYLIDNDGNEKEINSLYSQNSISFQIKKFAIILIANDEDNDMVNADKLEQVSEKIDEIIDSADKDKIISFVMIIAFGIYLIKEYIKNKDK